MKKSGEIYNTGFAHIMNESSFTCGRYYLIFISQCA